MHDPLTGELLRSIPTGRTHTWSSLAGDILTLGTDADRHVTAGRWSLSTGEERWTYRSAEPSPTSSIDWSGGVGEDVMGVEAGDFSVMLDPDTGEEVDRDLWGDGSDGDSSGPVPGPGGSTVSYRYGAEGLISTTVLGPDGEERFEVPGAIVGPDLDDGTASGMLFAAPPDPGSPSSVVAVDAVSGEVRWTADVPVSTVSALSGRIVVRDASGTAALDPRTGEQLWAVEADRRDAFGWDVVTDGRRLLSVEPGALGRPPWVGAPARTASSWPGT
ncbi:PQQ-binding-like beta-propeller repeat protein [Cellulomonas sp. ATA003]|uniref:outer membrane protein assembly factor BamB family protein n=1 Tax=Cellulomonas sp. ATA003 TaxID=3073064 RepID=UPI002873D87A|nr:PQQ-binding-like beta-propeller repeat protein [Cellulomonas sp. ATA003]WNB84789.1 PQQ-binding-like beta-propeller repeat protein [Cellulomonas sp. ATA003]